MILVPATLLCKQMPGSRRCEVLDKTHASSLEESPSRVSALLCFIHRQVKRPSPLHACSCAQLFGGHTDKCTCAVLIAGPGRKVDLVLSSGFLSFANHAGFLKAVDEV
jgi:hypothetical protein